MRFARWVFLIAGIYGVAVLLPGFFTEDSFNESTPPPVSHPEFYYGFYGSALVWQVAFLLIGADPLRYRPLMLVAVFEKLAFFAASLWLFLAGRMAVGGPLVGAIIDGVLMVLFLIAWRTSRAEPLP